jgi:hypothetical protein
VVAVRTTRTLLRAATTALTETAGTTTTMEAAGAGSTVEVMAATVEEVGEETAEEVEGVTDHAPLLSHLLVLHVDQR